MTSLVTAKWTLAAMTGILIFLLSGGGRSAFKPTQPIPVYVTGGQIIVLNGRAALQEREGVGKCSGYFCAEW